MSARPQLMLPAARRWRKQPKALAEFRVDIKVVREHFATITVRARNQDKADQLALDCYYENAGTEDSFGLGLPQPWEEHEPREFEPEIDKKFRCVDCDKDTSGGEYYMVHNEIWAASGLGPHDGMLCLADLERRIGRPLQLEDFAAIVPSKECWDRHLASRDQPPASEEAAE